MPAFAIFDRILANLHQFATAVFFEHKSFLQSDVFCLATFEILLIVRLKRLLLSWNPILEQTLVKNLSLIVIQSSATVWIPQ